jgi:adenine-specific DNA-methyltransferase
MEIDFHQFPTTRYYGSKRRLLPWVYSISKSIDFHTVFDRFGGTSSISLLFQSMGKKVIYHDALDSNTISAKLLLSNRNIDKNKINNFFTNVKPTKGFITKNFKNIYYSDEENRWLDGAIQNILEIDNNDSYWYGLFQACLKKRPFNTFHRANYNLRTAKVNRNFGNLTTWNKPFIEHINLANNELSNFIVQKNNYKKATVLTSNSLNGKCIEADLIYLDPPYIGNVNNHDDYYQKYHFLEGMVNYNDWDTIIDNSKKTKSAETPQYIKDWSNRIKYKQLLFKEVEKYKDKIVMLSYQTNGYPDVDSIYDFFVMLFDKVVIHKKPNFSHALSKTKKTEVVIIGYPR